MASLSNINGIFDVHSTGAIQFNGNHGTAGQILKSNGNAAPTWVAASTVIGGPYLPLTGGTLTGATATAAGISFTVGGTLTGTSATFSGNVTGPRFIGTSDRTEAVDSNDTRSTNPDPEDIGKGVYFDFKSNSANGLSDGGTYNGMMLWRSYGGGSDLTGGQPIRLAYTANGNLWRQMGTSATSWGTWNKFAIGTGTTAQYIRGDASLATFPTIPPDPTGVYLPLAGGIMSGNIGRSAYNSGYQVGGYNNIGASHAKTNPIHVIGTSYEPTATALSNMYGIGYTRADVSFLSLAQGSGWGLYVASDGDARIFLDGSQGDIYATNKICVNSYANQAGNLLFSAGQTTGTTRSLNLRTTNATSDPSNSDGSNSTGITWGQRTDSQPYYIIKPTQLNFGGGNYSKLTLNWHTGIRIGGHKNYGGTKFYNDAPDIVGETGVIMNVGVGNDNIGVVNALTVGGNVTAGGVVYASGGNSNTWNSHTSNTGTVTSVATGTGLTGGTITTTGTLSIDSTVATLAGSQTFTGNKYFNNFFLEFNSKTLANFNDLNNSQFEVSMYDVYNLATASTGMLSTYGTLFQINGRSSHTKTQFAFNGGNDNLQYRTSWYPNTAWTSFRQIWDSDNLPNPTQGGPYLPLSGGTITGTLGLTGIASLGNTAPSRVLMSDSTDVKYNDLATARSQFNLSYDTFRRITQTSDTNYWTGVKGWSNQSLNTTIPGMGSGFFDVWSSPAGQPSGATHWNGYQAFHYTRRSDLANMYGYQVALGAGDPNNMYVRGIWGGSSWGSWYRMHNDKSALIKINNQVSISTFNDRNLKIQGASSSDAGITGYASNGTHVFQLYGAGNDYGFLNGNWAAWDLRKTKNGNLYMNNSTTYYLNTSSTSYMNAVTLVGTFSGQNGYFNQDLAVGFNSGAIGGKVNIQVNSVNGIGVKNNLNGKSGATGLLQYTSASYASSGYNMVFQAVPPSGTDQNMLLCYLNGNIVNRFNSYGQYSDIKLKENIVDTTPKLEDVKKIRIRNFNFKGDSYKQIGVVAQEFEEVFPGLVEDKEVPNEEGTTKTVKYSVLVPILVKAIQELEARVKELENK